MGPTHKDLSVMKLLIFLIYTPLVYTEFHTFTTTYTGVTDIKGMPEFFAVSTLDDQQIDYYDSNTQTLISKQKWLEKYASTSEWIEDTVLREVVQEIYKNNINVLMSRFNQSGGIHTYQRMYGCKWDSETEQSDGFDEYGYDGNDFITLDVKNAYYISPVPQGFPTTVKWNDNRVQIELLQKYYRYDCVYWLKYFLNLRKAALRTTAPEVSLLQRSIESHVSCHVTGFYPARVRIYWLKNEQEQNKNVEVSEILPNEDGTFQKTARLSVGPKELKKTQYICVVEHISLTEKIWKILNVNEIRSNDGPVKLNPVTFAVIIMMVIIFALVVLFLKKQKFVHYKKLKDMSKPKSDHKGFDKCV